MARHGYTKPDGIKLVKQDESRKLLLLKEYKSKMEAMQQAQIASSNKDRKFAKARQANKELNYLSMQQATLSAKLEDVRMEQEKEEMARKERGEATSTITTIC
eukprot:1605503-Prymnesium_polylepis.1